MPAMKMVHNVDPREAIWARLREWGDITGNIPLGPRLLVAVYMRDGTYGDDKSSVVKIGGMTQGGIYLPQTNTDEDKWQGKVCLVVAKGDTVFPYDEKFPNERVEVGDWVVIRPADGLAHDFGKQRCYLVKDIDVQMRVRDPESVW